MAAEAPPGSAFLATCRHTVEVTAQRAEWVRTGMGQGADPQRRQTVLEELYGAGLDVRQPFAAILRKDGSMAISGTPARDCIHVVEGLSSRAFIACCRRMDPQ